MNRLQKLVLKLAGIKVKAESGYRMVGGTLVMMPDSKRSYVTNGYEINDLVYSIVQVILDKVRIAPFALYRVEDESSLKAYNALLRKTHLSGKEYKKALDLRSKALAELDNHNPRTSRVASLLKYANEQQTFSEMFTDGCGFKLITGDKYTWASILDAGANKGIPLELWQMPAHEVTIVADKMMSFPAKEVGYKLECWGKSYAKEEVLHEKYFNPNWGVSNQNLYGMSPLKAALKTMQRNNSAKEAAYAKFQNNGLEAVLWIDDNRLSGEQGVAQAQALKRKLVDEYTGEKNQGKIATSGYKTGVTNLGLSPVELGIIEAEKWDAVMLCAVFGVPPELIGAAQKTYNNMIEAEAALTSRSALPLLVSGRDSLNRKFMTDWGLKDDKVIIDFDLSVYGELQEDQAELWNYVKELPVTNRYKMQMMGLEVEENELTDQITIPSTFTQMSMDSEIDEALRDMDNAGSEEDVQG